MEKFNAKKARQILDNAYCETMYIQARTEYIKEKPCEIKFRTCKATTYETTNFIILKSYNTVVAIYDKANKVGVDVLRMTYGYTATSAQHIAKFFTDMAFFNGMKWRSNIAITVYREA